MTSDAGPSAEIEALIAAIGDLDVVDLSPTMRSRMPGFFTHPELHVLAQTRTMERDDYRLQTLIMPEHVGAHVDAPAHVLAGRPEATVDTFAPTALWGRAVVVDVSERDWAPGDLLDVDDFMAAAARREAKVREADVVLVNFGWDRHLQPGGRGAGYWSTNAPGFTEALCRELRDLGVRAVGSDSATCDSAWVKREMICAFGHVEYFLPNDIPIIECLDGLGRLPGIAYFAALPLKIAGGSGSPLRPIAFAPRA